MRDQTARPCTGARCQVSAAAVTFHICPKCPYRVPDNMVVHLLGAVDADDAKYHEDHGSCIHQGPHSRLPTARVHTRVEAKGGRAAGLGHCRRGSEPTLRVGPGFGGSPQALPGDVP